jgi:hypothetical protein
MADAPKKARKAQGPRQNKPIYILVRYTDESGNIVPLERSRVQVEAVKDPTKLIEMLLGSGADSMEGAAFVSFTPPTAERPAAQPA